MQQYPLVTIIGGAGFVGRHTVKLLAAHGYRIRVLTPDAAAAEFLRTSGNIGQIAIEYGDVTRPETIAGKLKGAEAVVNLAGISCQSGRQTFDAVHTAGARAVAAEAKKAGIRTMIHLSALGVELAGDTAYGRSKLAGELAVREALAESVILRPSLIIGPEDGFFQRFGRMSLISPILPLISGGRTKFQPVLVTDVAQTILAAMRSDDTRGKTYALAGPEIYSFRDLMLMMSAITGRKPCLVSIPTALAKIMGLFFEMLPFTPFITRDQVDLLAHDNVSGSNNLTFAQLGIIPAAITTMLPTYLTRYRKD